MRLNAHVMTIPLHVSLHLLRRKPYSDLRSGTALRSLVSSAGAGLRRVRALGSRWFSLVLALSATANNSFIRVR